MLSVLHIHVNRKSKESSVVLFFTKDIALSAKSSINISCLTTTARFDHTTH